MAYKIENFNLDCFKKELFEYSPYSILLTFKTVKLKEVLRLFWYCIKYRPGILVVENTYVASIVGILKLGFVEKIVYMPGDWLENRYFRFFDKLACLWAEVIWDITEEIRDKRGKIKREFVSIYRIENKFCEGKFRESVLFFGEERPESGLELVPPFHLIKMPYVPRSEFSKYFKECCCGINLLTKPSYTSYTIPSKVMDYLQFGLPVIVTKYCGPITKIIEKYDLGKVINPDKKEFFKAVKIIYDNQYYYRENIKRYIKSQKIPTLTEVFNL